MDNVDELCFDDLLEKALILELEEEIKATSKDEFYPSKTFQKKMKKLFRKKEGFLNKGAFIIRRVAIFFLVFLGAFTLLISFNKTARATFESFLEWADEYRKIFWYSDHLSIEVRPKEGEESRIEFSLDFIPEEYEVVEFEEFGSSKEVCVINKIGEETYITIIKNTASINFGLDNEHISYKSKEVSGKNYLIGYGQKSTFGNFILVEYRGYYYDYHSYDMTVEELINFSEKIFEKIENSL